jgi:hypothetical protein
MNKFEERLTSIANRKGWIIKSKKKIDWEEFNGLN